MRVDALDKTGGDVEHMRTYIRECERIAEERGLIFEGEILTTLDPDLAAFDVVHLSNLDRPVDLYAQFLAAQRAVKPIVLTPLHHSYREIECYERKGRGGLVGLFSGLIGFYRLEAARILVRSRRYPELRTALWKALRKGMRKAQAEVLLGCHRVLVITDKEATDIAQDVVALPANRMLKLVNGYDQVSSAAPDRDIEIAVIARVEARKNQIAILDAIESLGLKATFVGPPNVNHQRYCEHFQSRIDASSSTYIPGVPSAQVASILAKSKVHVAASWFEVSSLVDIDAYVNGCRVVASQCGGTRELLGDDAYYVDPASTADLVEKIAAAVKSARDGQRNSMHGFLQRTPAWRDTCVSLFDLYGVLTGSTRLPSARAD